MKSFLVGLVLLSPIAQAYQHPDDKCSGMVSNVSISNCYSYQADLLIAEIKLRVHLIRNLLVDYGSTTLQYLPLPTLIHS